LKGGKKREGQDVVGVDVDCRREKGRQRSGDDDERWDVSDDDARRAWQAQVTVSFAVLVPGSVLACNAHVVCVSVVVYVDCVGLRRAGERA